MAERTDRNDDLDTLLRQGIRDLVDPAAPSDGIWPALRRRIEEEPDPQTPTRHAAFRLPDASPHNAHNTYDQ